MIERNDDDWLNEPAPQPVVPFEVAPPASVEEPRLGLTDADKSALFKIEWQRLLPEQKQFLNAWRSCGFNERKTCRVLDGTDRGALFGRLKNWKADVCYKFCMEMLRIAESNEVLNREKLVLRQDEIAETALTPQPILHQGFATGHFEVDLGAATKANEVLLKVGGHLKEDKQDLSVGIIGPSLIIQVVQPDQSVKDITPRGVPIELPEPAVDDDAWLE
jgi:hypothetical protein